MCIRDRYHTGRFSLSISPGPFVKHYKNSWASLLFFLFHMRNDLVCILQKRLKIFSCASPQVVKGLQYDFVSFLQFFHAGICQKDFVTPLILGLFFLADAVFFHEAFQTTADSFFFHAAALAQQNGGVLFRLLIQPCQQDVYKRQSR